MSEENNNKILGEFDDFEELAEDIMITRQLPYTLTVEKVKGNIIWTHNQWGNSVIYRYNEEEETYDVLDYDEVES